MPTIAGSNDELKPDLSDSTAGALYSTTEDLLRWEQALFGGKVLSPTSLAKMTTPFKNDYAFGLIVQTASGRRVIQHGGGIEGFNTLLAYYPDSKVTVAVLANINGQAPGQIAAKLADLAHGGVVLTTSERKQIALQAAQNGRERKVLRTSTTVDSVGPSK
jgi:CubicO group peptidase (beta-lactamase class C family)